ncbi:hypothetical protein KVR01_010154 [Diaporthe batatas]|uniref:uncharacterized protein n=1 Tax=Diaporthe batatas TaxID=748121 RepID=UPI001D059EF8|nr:uncharacterized protein KVR01_010154 [Diaporthe batatas]KAG8159517.1 hypothetical protein KVR01_010154 [Diaporthe batatas]
MELTSLKDQIYQHFLKHHYQPWNHYSFYIVLPSLRHSQKSPLACRETPAEVQAASRSLSASIRELFRGLQSLQFYIDWQQRREKGRNPLIDPDGLHLTIHIPAQDISTPYEESLPCPHRIYPSHRLHLIPSITATLPHIPWITKLTIDQVITYDDEASTHFAGARPLSLRTPLELAARLPALQELTCPWLWERLPTAFAAGPEPDTRALPPPMAHYARVWEGPWRESRHELGSPASAALAAALPAPLRTARLWFWRADGLPDHDQAARLPDLVRPAAVDPLSAGVRHLAARLEVLDLRAFVMPDLFSASAGHAPWSGGMRRLRVEFHPFRPDGSWYFVGPRGEDPHPGGFAVGEEHYPPAVRTREDEEVDEDYGEDQAGHGRGYEHDARSYDLFQVEPSAERVEPLLEAFGEALGGMPSLEEAELFAWLTWQPSDEREREYGGDGSGDESFRSWRWGIRYVSAKDGMKGRVEWQVGDWRPREEIVKLFESLGGGDGVEVEWKPLEKHHGRATWKDDESW